jgi:hypothetical protein
LIDLILAFPSGFSTTFNIEVVVPDSYELFGNLRISHSPPLETISDNVFIK